MSWLSHLDVIFFVAVVFILRFYVLEIAVCTGVFVNCLSLSAYNEAIEQLRQ
ncbi:hypothetical protein DSUL_20446 [Desulfovibrionales bacterium]